MRHRVRVVAGGKCLRRVRIPVSVSAFQRGAGPLGGVAKGTVP